MTYNDKKLILIRVKSDYIRYLRRFDKKVQINFEELKKDTKPFLGVLFFKNNIEYFVPISSNKKKKYIKMYNKYIKDNQKPIDIFFIQDKNNKLLAVLNFNNMIPIIAKAKINFDILKDKDRSLLIKEIEYCNKNRKEIMKTAKRVYNAVTIYNWEKLKIRSCDFKLLEEKCKEY